ncbi:MAG: PilZ domain-containing protein [Lachnospiraceae bacterium]|nr:PilZ domain-containing protein [Lachnospiraceae bacterium]
MEERRKSKRIQLDAKLMVKRLNGEGQNEVIIEVFDLSKTGIGFNCKQPLMIGSVYEAYITIWTKEVIHAFIEIVRSTKEDNMFRYGGIFIGMPEMDARRIETYDTVCSEMAKNN